MRAAHFSRSYAAGGFVVVKRQNPDLDGNYSNRNKMIAKKLSATVVPMLQSLLVLCRSWSRTAGLGIVKLVTFMLTDFATVAACGAIAWGVHFWSVPAAWIAGGVLTILLVAISVKPLR
jgi:hypothetical protein